MLRNFLIGFSIFNSFVAPEELKPQSICSLGESFDNKYDAYDDVVELSPKLMETQEILGIERNKINKLVKEKAAEINRQINQVRDTVLKDLSEQTIQNWFQYFVKLIDGVEKTQLRKKGRGACDEGTKASIIHSVVKQLTTGHHETVQKIGIRGIGGFYDQPNHQFVVYNAKIMPAKLFLKGQTLEDILKNLQPFDSKNPVIICDSWIDFHGTSGKWFANFTKKDLPSPYVGTKWQQIDFIDYSLPSIKKLNKEQRRFMTNLMKNILSPIATPDKEKVEQLKSTNGKM